MKAVLPWQLRGALEELWVFLSLRIKIPLQRRNGLLAGIPAAIPRILPVRKPRSPRLQTLVKEGSAKVVVPHPLCRKRAQPLWAQKIGWTFAVAGRSPWRMDGIATGSPRKGPLLALPTAPPRLAETRGLVLTAKRGGRKPLQEEPVSALGKR